MIKGIQKTSLIDYPDRICAIFFTEKCNFKCPFCFNKELVLDYKKLPEIKEKEIFEFLDSRKNLIDGVCISGGEPTLHKELIGLIEKIKKKGFLVKLDTNGSNPKMLKELIEKKLVDFIAMDIKGPIKKYDLITKTKVNKKNIRQSIELIKKNGIDYEFRTTVVPKLLDKKDLIEIGKQLNGSKKYCIQQFRNQKTLDEKMQCIQPYSKEELEEMVEEVKKFFEKVEIRS